MPNFEMTFMAIASKNGFLTHEEAAEALAEFNNPPAGSDKRGIEEIVLAHGMLTADQVRIISSGAKKILAAQAAPPPVAPAARPGTQRIPTQPPPAEGARPGTQRIPTQPPPKPNPNQPIPGIRL